MSKKAKVYTTIHCPFCVRAKELLDSQGIDYETIDLSDNPEELMALKERTGMRTVPQIFIDGEFIGGFQELVAFQNSGQLKGTD